MSAVFDIESLKRKSLEFVNLIGNEHDTTSAKIIGLLDKEFAVQHAKLPPSKGGRDAFLTKLGERLKLAQGHVSLEVKHVISESCEQGPNYAQCWIYSRKRTPFGFTNSVCDPSLLLQTLADKK